jgi:hypothetical protein
MSLGNTPRRETNIAVEANKSYAFGIHLKDVENRPIDITDCVIRLVATQGAQGGGLEVLDMVAVHVTDVAGFVQFQFQAEDLALDPGTYSYDVTFLPPSGYSTPLLKGNIEVGVNADLDSSNVYNSVNVGSDVTAIMRENDLVEITMERLDGLYLVVTSLIKDFVDTVAAEIAKANAAADRAEAGASLSNVYADRMKDWLDNAGYPFWKGTQAEFDTIAHKRHILYLIVDDEVTP